jgi:hypothetical protein
MSPKASKIRNELLTTELTRQELESLFAIIQLKLGNLREQIKVQVETADSGDHSQSILYSCLAELWLAQVGEKSPTLNEVRHRNRALFDELKECASVLEEFTKQNIVKPSRMQTTALFKLFLRLAYDECRAVGGMITPTRVIALRDRCGALIDDQFPGYLKSKLLRVVLNGASSRLR